MLAVLVVYCLLSLGCFGVERLMDVYSSKRFKREGYKLKKSEFPVFSAIIGTIAALGLNFVPVLNTRRAFNILFKREEEYQRLKNINLAFGHIYKDPEPLKYDFTQDLSEVPPKLEHELEHMASTINIDGVHVVIRVHLSGSMPKNPEDFINGIPHIVVGSIPFVQSDDEETHFENMSVGEKIEFLMRQRGTIIESTGYEVGEPPKDKEEEQGHQI